MAVIKRHHVATDNSAVSPRLAKGQRSSCNIIGRAEMRADAAALGAKLTQLLLRQEPDETIKDGLHLRAGSVHIALLNRSPRGRKAIVPHRNVGQAMLDEAVLRRRDERSEASAYAAVVEHPIRGQQGGAVGHQLLEDIDIGDSGVLS